MAGTRKKRLLTPEMFDLNERGEVVIRENDLLNRVKSAKDGDGPSEHGVGIGIVLVE